MVELKFQHYSRLGVFLLFTTSVRSRKPEPTLFPCKLHCFMKEGHTRLCLGKLFIHNNEHQASTITNPKQNNAECVQLVLGVRGLIQAV